MKRYFAKPDTFFKAGTEAFRKEEVCPFGSIFTEEGKPTAAAAYEGTYVVGSNRGIDSIFISRGHKIGDEVLKNEICGDDEFDVIEG